MGTDEDRTKTKQQTTLSLVYNITADDVETPKNEKGGEKRGKTINENIRKSDESAKFRTHAKCRAFVCAVPVRDTPKATSLPGSIPGGYIVERRVCSFVHVSVSVTVHC